MAGFIKQIKIVSNDGLPDIERIDAQLKALILTAEGSIPGSRGFGLPHDFISMRSRDAQNVIAIELEEKVAEFIPEITIASVKAEVSLDGKLTAQIQVERRAG